MSVSVEPSCESLPTPGKRYFAATRPAFLSATLMAGLLGLASAAHDGIEISLWLAIVTIWFALVAHAGINVLNDYYDSLNGTDEMNTERVYPFTGGSRFIQNGVLSQQQMRDYGYLLMASVAVAGLWLVTKSAPQLLFIGVAGVFIGWAYSAPPFKLASRGWGEVCVAAGILLITIGADFVMRKSFAWMPIFVGFSYALLATNLLYINQFPDRKADTAAGKLHWVARLDVRQASWGYVLIALMAYSWILLLVAGGVLSHWILISLLALPASVSAARQLFTHAQQPQQLTGAIQQTIAAMLLQGALMSVACILG